MEEEDTLTMVATASSRENRQREIHAGSASSRSG